MMQSDWLKLITGVSNHNALGILDQGNSTLKYVYEIGYYFKNAEYYN